MVRKALVLGEAYDGLVSKITDYGCFVKIGGAEQSLGLVHVSTLSDERIDADEVMEVDSDFDSDSDGEREERGGAGFVMKPRAMFQSFYYFILGGVRGGKRSRKEVTNSMMAWFRAII